jgi:hypothetical protein
MEKLTAEEIVNRGEQAKRLLENPMFAEACEKARDALRRLWEGTEWGDREARDWYYAQVAAIDSIEKALRRYLDAGVMVMDRVKQREIAEGENGVSGA